MKVLFVAALLLVGAPALAGDELPGGIPAATGSMAAADVGSEAAIRKMYDEYEAAWNRHDPAGIAGFWAEDGDRLESDGTASKGRKQLESLLREQHAGAFKESVLSQSLDSVWFIVDGVALADGPYTITGIRDADGKVVPPRRGHLANVLVRDGGVWRIGASRVMAATAPLARAKD